MFPPDSPEHFHSSKPKAPQPVLLPSLFDSVFFSRLYLLCVFFLLVTYFYTTIHLCPSPPIVSLLFENFYPYLTHFSVSKIPLNLLRPAAETTVPRGLSTHYFVRFFSYFFNFLNTSPKLSIPLMIASSSGHYLKSPHQMKSFVSVTPLSFS